MILHTSIKYSFKPWFSKSRNFFLFKKISFFEGPHTGKNFLTSEMINNIKNVYKFMGKAYHNESLVAESEFSAMITSK